MSIWLESSGADFVSTFSRLDGIKLPKWSFKSGKAEDSSKRSPAKRSSVERVMTSVTTTTKLSITSSREASPGPGRP